MGGYGVFGGRLAQRLVIDKRFDVLVAGRSFAKAKAFCDTYGGSPVLLDLANGDLTARVADLSPFIVVDAAGPFQAYQKGTSYRLALAAIQAGAHYLDLSDDADFTSGISMLDDAAREATLSVLSGVSSVPALSSTIASFLSDDLSDIHHIETIILPGNKAPRGLSVVRAIVAQAGQSMRVWIDNQWSIVKGWSGRKTVTLRVPGAPPLKSRWASLIGAPDLKLFPDTFNARSVEFRAGLDLKLMHGGLAILSLPVRWGWSSSIAPLSKLLKWAADRLEAFGSDRGGMRVRVIGMTASGQALAKHWTLLVEDGDGPFIPAIPAQILCAKLLDGTLDPGARPALTAFSKDEAEQAFSSLRIITHVETQPLTPLFQSVLGEDYADLPPQVRALHNVLQTRRWVGQASIQRGTGFLSKLAGWFAGFPPASDSCDVEVKMIRTAKGETWIRRFGSHQFRSYLSSDEKGHLTERFGLLRFTIALRIENNALRFPVTRGTFLGVPLPAFLLPKSQTAETIDPEGRAKFDVSISLPLARHVVTYRGYLQDPGA